MLCKETAYLTFTHGLRRTKARQVTMKDLETLHQMIRCNVYL
jgi:hypothetical protein